MIEERTSNAASMNDSACLNNRVDSMREVVKTNQLQFIISLRGIGCIAIVFSHLFLGFFSGSGTLASTWPFFPAFHVSDPHLIQPYILAFMEKSSLNSAPIGLGVFFLITGFTSALSLERDGSFRYLIKRFLRLYPTYIMGFSITMLSIYAYVRYQGGVFPYTMKEYLAHITLFRNWLWSPYIDNGVWTLEINVDFYILIFLLYFIFRKKERKPVVGTAIVLGILQIILYFIASNHLDFGSALWRILNTFTSTCPYIIYHLIGVVIGDHYNHKISTAGACGSIAVLIGVFFTTHYFSFDTIMYINSYSYSILIFLFFYVSREQIFQNGVIDFISKISYPLYIVHGVPGYILLTVLYYHHQIDPYVSSIIAIATGVLIAYVINITVESHSVKLYKRFLSAKTRQD